MKIKAILFDLDGTLLDTAPDLVFAINKLLDINNCPTLPYPIARPLAGHGGRVLIKAGFNIEKGHPNFDKLWQGFLKIYSEHICVQTTLFPGIQEVLNYLLEKKIPWGIVTNKPGWLTEPLLKKLNLFNQAACIVSGDTLSVAKPDPAPILHACKLITLQAHECIYIGDAERDIQASAAAGMQSLIAKWGYITDTDPFDQWGADGILEKPEELIDWLKRRILVTR